MIDPLKTNQTTWRNLPNDSRIWVYQSTNPLSAAQEQKCQRVVGDFVQRWSSHGNRLKADWALFNARFLVLFVAEEIGSASGCSIDSSVHMLQSLGDELGINWFDRTKIAVAGGEGIDSIAVRDLWAKLKADVVSQRSTFIFDNLIQKKSDLSDSWLLPIEKSWFAQAYGL